MKQARLERNMDPLSQNTGEEATQKSEMSVSAPASTFPDDGDNSTAPFTGAVDSHINPSRPAPVGVVSPSSPIAVPERAVRIGRELENARSGKAQMDINHTANTHMTTDVEIESRQGGIVGRTGVMWLAMISMLVAAVVFVGPKIVEEYAYSYARGKSRAEYEVAKVALQDRPLEGISTMFEFVAKKISPSVVHIETISNRVREQGLLYLQKAKGQGSGIIFSSDGYVVTNQHVVAGAREIRVTLYDRSVFSAEVIGIDEPTDLAVLKINASGLVPGEWADEEQIRVGAMAWAVGSPFGLDQSITSGIVSGRHRRVKSPASPNESDYVFKDLIQTDAAINPGNSGGPLVNSTGDIMGVNTSIIGGSYQGVCFAVPSPIVVRIVNEIIEKGHVERGYLGVYPTQVSVEYARKQGLPDYNGAFVSRVEPGTPAYNAGIRAGDIIRKWNEQVVESELTLFTLVGGASADSQVNLEIYRDGRELTKNVRIGLRADVANYIERPWSKPPRLPSEFFDETP